MQANKHNYIRSFQYTFTAAQTKVYAGGGYLSIEELTNDVDLEFFDQHNNSLGVVQNIGAGFWVDLTNFGKVHITSATAQTVNVLIGTGSFGVNKTSTTITGGTLTAETLETHYGGIIGTSLVTIATPAANTAGIKIHDIKLNAGAAGYCQVMSKTSAPATWNDVTARSLAFYESDAVGKIFNRMSTKIIVPAGEGLYAQGTAASVANCHIEYEIL